MAIVTWRRNHHWQLVWLALFGVFTSTDAFLPNYQNINVGQYYHPSSTTSTTYGHVETRIEAVAKSGGKLMETEEMYTETVLERSASNGPVLVFFSAPWCGPCRLTNPVVKDIMKQFAGELEVVEICTDDLAEVAGNAGVVSIPTIQFYYNGELMETIVGCVAKSVLANAVEKVLDDVQQLQQKRAP